jgi:AraC-like DNA-binding protein
MDRRVAQLIEAVRAHSGAVDWNLRRACRELKLDISSAYAARLFRRDTGVGIRAYANQQRLLAGTKQLADDDAPVKIIAAGLGYKQPCHLARFLKKQQFPALAAFRKRVS